MTKYLGKKKVEAEHNIQVRIPISLVKKIRPFMKENHITWKNLFSGIIMAQIDEMETTKGKKKRVNV